VNLKKRKENPMADYFTNFSLIVTLPNKEAQDYALEISCLAARIQQGDEKEACFPASLVAAVEDWHFETVAESLPDHWGVWLHSSSGGIDAVCAFIQHLLQKFEPQGHVGFEWSHDCSKPRVDAFGGGAAFITAHRIKFMNTGQWLHKQTARFLARKPAKQKAVGS
jgi:hypothetical protein